MRRALVRQVRCARLCSAVPGACEARRPPSVQAGDDALGARRSGMLRSVCCRHSSAARRAVHAAERRDKSGMLPPCHVSSSLRPPFRRRAAAWQRLPPAARARALAGVGGKHPAVRARSPPLPQALPPRRWWLLRGGTALHGRARGPRVGIGRSWRPRWRRSAGRAQGCCCRGAGHAHRGRACCERGGRTLRHRRVAAGASVASPALQRASQSKTEPEENLTRCAVSPPRRVAGALEPHARGVGGALRRRAAVHRPAARRARVRFPAAASSCLGFVAHARCSNGVTPAELLESTKPFRKPVPLGVRPAKVLFRCSIWRSRRLGRRRL
jgi:hypothetical protein